MCYGSTSNREVEVLFVEQSVRGSFTTLKPNSWDTVKHKQHEDKTSPSSLTFLNTQYAYSDMWRCVRAQGTNDCFCDDASTHLKKSRLKLLRGTFN